MAKLLEELMVMRKWEMETMILRLGPHGSGWSPVPLVNFSYDDGDGDFDDDDNK